MSWLSKSLENFAVYDLILVLASLAVIGMCLLGISIYWNPADRLRIQLHSWVEISFWYCKYYLTYDNGKWPIALSPCSPIRHPCLKWDGLNFLFGSFQPSSVLIWRTPSVFGNDVINNILSITCTGISTSYMSYEHIDNNQIVHNLSYTCEIIRKNAWQKGLEPHKRDTLGYEFVGNRMMVMND